MTCLEVLDVLLIQNNTFVGHFSAIHIWVAGQCFPCVEIMIQVGEQYPPKFFSRMTCVRTGRCSLGELA